jgi:hypothetical protein
MPSGYKIASGVDLDTVFRVRLGVKRADVGYKVAGVDLSERYEKRGGTGMVAVTGYKVEGVDLNELFAPPGS